jgi:hypothetical protein
LPGFIFSSHLNHRIQSNPRFICSHVDTLHFLSIFLTMYIPRAEEERPSLNVQP